MSCYSSVELSSNHLRAQNGACPYDTLMGLARPPDRPGGQSGPRPSMTEETETGASRDSTTNRTTPRRAGQRRQDDSPKTSYTRHSATRRWQHVTINEHDRVTTGRKGAGDASSTLTGAHALVDLLNAGEPYAVAFGGQGGNWLENLEELISSAGIESELSEVVGESALLLEPVARELVVVRPIGFEPMHS